MPYSSYTEWYFTYSGGEPVDIDDLWAYYDPKVPRTFSSSGTYWVRAEIWVGGTWVQAHRFKVIINTPPSKPSNIQADNLSDTSAKILWNAAIDDDGDTLTYEVLYGKTYYWDGWTSGETTTGNYKTISGLSSDYTYTVKIVVNDGNGGENDASYSGLFKTLKANYDPNEPTNPDPYNGKTNVSVNSDLDWSCSDPDGDKIYYTVYLGKDDSSPDNIIKNDSDQIAIYAMVVDAINDNAKGFYEQFGFARLSDDSPRLFLPLKSFENNPSTY